MLRACSLQAAPRDKPRSGGRRGLPRTHSADGKLLDFFVPSMNSVVAAEALLGRPLTGVPPEVPDNAAIAAFDWGGSSTDVRLYPWMLRGESELPVYQEDFETPGTEREFEHELVSRLETLLRVAEEEGLCILLAGVATQPALFGRNADGTVTAVDYGVYGADAVLLNSGKMTAESPDGMMTVHRRIAKTLGADVYVSKDYVGVNYILGGTSVLRVVQGGGVGANALNADGQPITLTALRFDGEDLRHLIGEAMDALAKELWGHQRDPVVDPPDERLVSFYHRMQQLIERPGTLLAPVMSRLPMVDPVSGQFVINPKTGEPYDLHVGVAGDELEAFERRVRDEILGEGIGPEEAARAGRRAASALALSVEAPSILALAGRVNAERVDFYGGGAEGLGDEHLHASQHHLEGRGPIKVVTHTLVPDIGALSAAATARIGHLQALGLVHTSPVPL